MYAALINANKKHNNWVRAYAAPAPCNPNFGIKNMQIIIPMALDRPVTMLMYSVRDEKKKNPATQEYMPVNTPPATNQPTSGMASRYCLPTNKGPQIFSSANAATPTTKKKSIPKYVAPTITFLSSTPLRDKFAY